MATGGDVGVVELVACVVGLSRSQGEDFTEHEGVGKSCLCYRFIYPESDSDINADDHKSLFALHEFTSPVINSTHFLYWGNQLQTYATSKSSKISSSSPSARVMFHVIEQTVFYRDETSKPFLSSTSPDALEQYARRITGSIESPGKLSYKSCNDIESNSEKLEYPSRLSSRVPRGFLVVLDVSVSADEFESQLKKAEHVLGHLMKLKQKYVVVAAKRDNCNTEALENAHKLKRKYHTQVIETSASRNVNVQAAFRILASKVLHKKLPGISENVPPYEEAVLSDEMNQDANMKNTLSRQQQREAKRRSGERVKGWRKSKLLFGRTESDDTPVVANDTGLSQGELESKKAMPPSPDLGGGDLSSEEVDIVALCPDIESHLDLSEESKLKHGVLESSKAPPPKSPSEREGGGGKPSFWKDWRSLKQVWRKSGVQSTETHEQEPLLHLQEDSK